MVMIVVVIDTLISLILFFVAWRVWKLKQIIGRIADKLTVYERNTSAALYKTPENIYIGQRNIQNLRQGNQGLQVKIQQVRQIVGLLFLGRRVWGRSLTKTGIKLRKKAIAK